MESSIELNKYNNYIRYLITNNKDLLNNTESLTIEQIDMIVNNLFEKKTGLTLYNKPFLMMDIQKRVDELKKIESPNNPNLMELSYEPIIKNLVPEVKFNTLFKSNLDFSLVFDSDDILIFYQGKKIEIKDLDWVSKDLLNNKLSYLPEITEIYVGNIIKTIELLINKDLTVKYHCVDFPQPYWNLFEIKCKKTNPLYDKNMSKYSDIKKIISGEYYKQPEPVSVQVTNQDNDTELQDILRQIKEFEENEKNKLNPKIKNTLLSKEQLEANDGQYRMEIMSYLNDDDLIFFLDSMEKIDASAKNVTLSDDSTITKHIKLILDTFQNGNNKILKFYIIYLVFKFIQNCEEYISKYDGLRQTISLKLNEFNGDLIIVKTAGLQYSQAIEQVFQTTRDFIDSIEKKKNPDYVPKWTGIDNQEQILNQIQQSNNIGPEAEPEIEPYSEDSNDIGPEAEPEMEPYSEESDDNSDNNPGANYDSESESTE